MSYFYIKIYSIITIVKLSQDKIKPLLLMKKLVIEWIASFFIGKDKPQTLSRMGLIDVTDISVGGKEVLEINYSIEYVGCNSISRSRFLFISSLNCE